MLEDSRNSLTQGQHARTNPGDTQTYQNDRRVQTETLVSHAILNQNTEDLYRDDVIMNTKLRERQTQEKADYIKRQKELSKVERQNKVIRGPVLIEDETA